ncbi:ABC transporter permease subunit [Alkaliphilus hydrothermalis]|uniref:ABC-2 type transport system permease protein n=1 Tax=Alkaliphilus hydrothermalis TaxID=1482730 RepID=A0ABS2NLL9_9FIRM|nr:ABC transporter permease subunit [Alkaliphilus hydrothermalis]MBM7613829.1 ABC-2 type transport system permease protein [Alkaliphilus hydrothermalis]
MNVFLREMKAHRKSLIFWSIGIVFMIAGGMGKYVGMSMAGSEQTMNDLMNSMPRAMKAIFGVGTLDLSKVSGFYGVLFLYLVLMGAIHACMMGANIISKEERDKTSEFLLVKPISRKTIISSKLMATLANIIIFNLVTLASSFIFVNQYGKGEKMTEDIVILMMGLFLLQLIFMSIGTAIAAISKKPTKAIGLSTGILMISFLLSIAIDMNSKIEPLKYFTPFKYFEAKNLMYGGGLEPVFVILSVGIITVLSIATYYFYQQRDMNV